MFLVCRGLCLRKVMSANSAIAKRLEQRAQQADQIIARLKVQLRELKNSVASSCGSTDVAHLRAENTQLQLEVRKALNKLVALETSHGVLQVPMPKNLSSQASDIAPGTSGVKGQDVPVSGVNQVSEPVKGQEIPDKAKQAQAKQAKAEKKGEKKEKKRDPSLPTIEPDITALDLRIGRIIDVKRHPDADTLYVEQIELGEASPRTVVTGVVNHVTIEEMENRMVIICCNLKPAKMRGVLSQAMVMCAATDDKVEILIPPEGAVPGDRVSCQGYELGDYPSQMNPKKKIFEQIKPHLMTNSDKVAGYKGAPFTVKGKGLCVAESLCDATVR